MGRNLPGYDAAEALGYSLCSYSSNKESAIYTKGKLQLTIDKEGKTKLQAVYKMIILHIGWFTLPNKNFKLFENQMLQLLEGT